jgi:hypothetical protein
MKHPSLTIGGFMQTNIARILLEHPMNVDKGLHERYLWIVPNPNPMSYKELEKVENDFTNSIGMSLCYVGTFHLIILYTVTMLRNIRRSDQSITKCFFPKLCDTFQVKNDLTWQQVQDISCADELLSRCCIDTFNHFTSEICQDLYCSRNS